MNGSTIHPSGLGVGGEWHTYKAYVSSFYETSIVAVSEFKYLYF